MSIVNSRYALEHAQRDGRIWVTETHTDSEGLEHVVRYLAQVDTDYAAILASRAASIEQALIEAEIEAVLNG